MESGYPEGFGILTQISKQDNPKGVSTGQPDLENPLQLSLPKQV